MLTCIDERILEELTDLVCEKESIQLSLQRLLRKTIVLPGETNAMNYQELERLKEVYLKELVDLGCMNNQSNMNTSHVNNSVNTSGTRLHSPIAVRNSRRK